MEIFAKTFQNLPNLVTLMMLVKNKNFFPKLKLVSSSDRFFEKMEVAMEEGIIQFSYVFKYVPTLTFIYTCSFLTIKLNTSVVFKLETSEWKLRKLTTKP